MDKDWNDFVEFMNTVKNAAISNGVTVDEMLEVYNICHNQGYIFYEPIIKDAANSIMNLLENFKNFEQCQAETKI